MKALGFARRDKWKKTGQKAYSCSNLHNAITTKPFYKRHTLKCVVFKSLAFVLFSECKIRVKTRNKNIFFGRFHIFTNSTPTTDILEKHKTTRATQTPSLCAKGEFQRWNRRKSPLKMWKITPDAYFLQAVVSGNHRLTFPIFHTVELKTPILEAQRKRKTKENTENRVVSTVPARFQTSGQCDFLKQRQKKRQHMYTHGNKAQGDGPGGHLLALLHEA